MPLAITRGAASAAGFGFGTGENFVITYLMVGGGGGGGDSFSNAGAAGGGGGGGVITGAVTINRGTYAVTVGNGGEPAGDGEPSLFAGLTAAGGGRGGTAFGDPTAGNGGTSGNGFVGGEGLTVQWQPPTWALGGGGGGGAGGTGGIGFLLPDSNAWLSGNSGAFASTISIGPVNYAQLGQGGVGGALLRFPVSSIDNRVYGGYITYSFDINDYIAVDGGQGATNLGWGGSGGAQFLYLGNYITANSGRGGSGQVVIAYQSATPRATGGTITQTGGWVYHTFLSNGTFTF